MAVLFWYISKSVFSSLPVSAVHEFFPGDIFDFILIPFSVSEFAGFKKHIYVYILYIYTYKLA